MKNQPTNQDPDKPIVILRIRPTIDITFLPEDFSDDQEIKTFMEHLKNPQWVKDTLIDDLLNQGSDLTDTIVDQVSKLQVQVITKDTPTEPLKLIWRPDGFFVLENDQEVPVSPRVTLVYTKPIDQTVKDIQEILERYGILDKLEERS